MKSLSQKKFPLFILLLCFSFFSLQAKEKYLYQLSEPFETKVQLGPIIGAINTIHVVGFEVAKIWAYSIPMGWSNALLLYSVVDLPYIPQSFITRPTAELAVKSWLKSKKQIAQFARVPYLHSISMLSGKRTEWKANFIPFSQTRKGSVLLETDSPLTEADLTPENWKAEWGKPILIEDPSKYRLRLNLSIEGKPLEVADWKPSLKDIQEKVPIPQDIAEAWRQEIKTWREEQLKKMGFIGRKLSFFSLNKYKGLQVNGELSISPEETIRLGSILEGSSVAQFLKANWLSKTHQWAKSLVGLPQKEKALTLIKAQVTHSFSCSGLFSRLMGSQILIPKTRP